MPDARHLRLDHADHLDVVVVTGEARVHQLLELLLVDRAVQRRPRLRQGARASTLSVMDAMAYCMGVLLLLPAGGDLAYPLHEALVAEGAGCVDGLPAGDELQEHHPEEEHV